MLQLLVYKDCFTNIFLNIQKYSKENDRVWQRGCFSTQNFTAMSSKLVNNYLPWSHWWTKGHQHLPYYSFNQQQMALFYFHYDQHLSSHYHQLLAMEQELRMHKMPRNWVTFNISRSKQFYFGHIQYIISFHSTVWYYFKTSLNKLSGKVNICISLWGMEFITTALFFGHPVFSCPFSVMLTEQKGQLGANKTVLCKTWARSFFSSVS